MFNLWHSVTVECIIGRPVTVVVVGDDERENDDRWVLQKLTVLRHVSSLIHCHTDSQNNDVRFSFLSDVNNT